MFLLNCIPNPQSIDTLYNLNKINGFEGINIDFVSPHSRLIELCSRVLIAKAFNKSFYVVCIIFLKKKFLQIYQVNLIYLEEPQLRSPLLII